MPTHTVKTYYQTGSENLYREEAFTDDTALEIDVTLAASTAQTWTGGITVANLKCLAISVTGATTVKATNSGGATLFGGSQLAAGTTLVYPTQATAAAALGGSDITALYLLPGAAESVVKIRAILSNAP